MLINDTHFRLSIRVAEMYKFNPRTLTKEEETIMEKTLEIIQVCCISMI